VEPADVSKSAFATPPLTSPSFARGAYRYTNNVERTQKHTAWKNCERPKDRLTVFDLTKELDPKVP
jgi:hypothetical protein